MSKKQIKQKKSENWLEVLPKDGAKKVKEKLGDKLSERQIYRILVGECHDKHGVIKLAIEVIRDHQKQLALLKKKKEQLKRSPLNSK